MGSPVWRAKRDRTFSARDRIAPRASGRTIPAKAKLQQWSAPFKKCVFRIELEGPCIWLICETCYHDRVIEETQTVSMLDVTDV